MLITIAAASLAAAEPPALRPGLDPLGFLVGHCWQGRFASGEVDTHCFDTLYGGQHVRDRHRVEGGARLYEGETLYSRDGDAVAFTYVNSLGGISRGTMRAEAGRLVFSDEVYSAPDGRRIALSTHWRRVGEDAWEAVTTGEQASMNRTVRYERVAADAVAISEAQAPDGSRMLVHETIVPAPAAQVWTAIATADGWRTWAAPVARGGEGRIETSYAPDAPPGGPATIVQQVLAELPGRIFAFATVRAPDGFPHFDAYRRVTSVIELEPIDAQRTRVRLTGAGYPDDDAGRALIGFFREGNRVSLDRLRRRFESGPIDWAAELRSQR